MFVPEAMGDTADRGSRVTPEASGRQHLTLPESPSQSSKPVRPRIPELLGISEDSQRRAKPVPPEAG